MAAFATDMSSAQMKLRKVIYLYPIETRIKKLTLVLKECSMKDFQVLFPFLVENIFGVNPSFGNSWNLLTTSRSNNCADFDALYQFLHPSGTLFEIIYKLLGDVYSKYEYPITLLPQRLRQMILDGTVPSFSIDKLQIDPNLRTPTALVLNSFEFYLFHFGFHLLNCWQEHDSQKHGPDTVYLHLSDQYLQYFLPVESSVVLPIVPIHQAISLPRSSPPQVQPQKIPKLFKASAVKIGSTSLSPPAVSQPHAEVWRSETFIQVTIYFWLSVSDHMLNSNPFAALKSQNFYRYPVVHGPYTRMPKFCYYPDMRTPEDNLPRESRLRVVRNMIKHIHYFVNNFHNDGSAIDELRKISHSLYREPLYTFLRQNIHHWPLDSSFLLMLETYLSFIQPWRYIKYNAPTRDEGSAVDHRWYNFIVENFPAYTVLLREIIPRFLKMDLTSPKHAHMLYRLSKVLSLPNLADMLRDIERSLDLSTFGNESSYLPPSPYRSPKSPGNLSFQSAPSSPCGSLNLSSRRNTIIRQEFLELESPNFQYKALFDQEFRALVHEFIINAQRSLVLVQNWLNSAMAQQKMKKSGLIQSIREFLLLPTSCEDYTIDEKRKTVTYLEASIYFLSSTFEIQLPDVFDKKPATIDNSTSISGSDTETGQMNTVEPLILDPEIWRKRTKTIRYDANPDLEPIRSTEITFLVRFFHQISSRINEMYGDHFIQLWHRNDIWGLIAKQLLAPPCRYHYFDKSNPGNFARRISVDLPPRVSFRALASHQTMSYFFLSGLLAFFYQYPIVPFYLCIFCLYLILLFVKAFILNAIGRYRQTPTSPSPFATPRGT